MAKKLITILTPCYNEELNVREVHRRLMAVAENLPEYQFEHLFIDNASTDNTVSELRAIAAGDASVRVIVNARNFGADRSGMHGFLQAKGDAVGTLVADLQDPPELFIEMIRAWETGFPIVAAIKNSSDENGLMYRVRTGYYRLVARLTNVRILEHFTGFGLYDRSVVERIRTGFPDPYPYFRGMIAELGLPIAKVFYNQNRRERGISSYNFYTLYDFAMLGITNLSKVPLRLVIFCGFLSALVSFVAGMFYLVYKLVFWAKLQCRRSSIGPGSVFSWVDPIDCTGHYWGVCRVHPHACAESPARDRERTHQFLVLFIPRDICFSRIAIAQMNSCVGFRAAARDRLDRPSNSVFYR